MRFFLYLSYKGTAYNGWQRQPNAPSVQQCIEESLSTLLKCPTDIVGAGRTDTGVHASYYVAHFDSDNSKVLDHTDFCYHLNCILPKDIAIEKIELVPDNAHARFDARVREYKYFVSIQKNPFAIETSYLCLTPLDIDKMNDAAQTIKEYSDFTSFCKLHSDNKTNICNVTSSHWEFKGDKLVYTVAADRFLRNMVRAIVGTLLDVGRGKITTQEFRHIIEKRSRGAASSSAAACGLFLTNIEYN